MSEVGILSYELKQASDLASKLDSVLEHSQSGTVDRQERTELALVLRGLLDLLDPLRPGAMDPGAVMRVPVGLVRRLRDTTFDGMRFSDALAELASGLAERDHHLSDRELNLLHEVAAANEREVSTVFRRMVRR